MYRVLSHMIEFEREGERRVYDLYVGDYICIRGSSANGYWHDVARYEHQYGDVIIGKATVMVLSDNGLVGFWHNVNDVRKFIQEYLRGTITEEIDSQS